MKIFSAPETRQALPYARLIDRLRALFVQGCEVPPRHTHTIAQADGGHGTVLIMPAWRADSYLGIKTVSIFPSNARQNLPGLFSSYLLCDARTGAPLAYLDGNEITARRTAATSALAASVLTPAQPQRLLIVGAGRVAAELAPAYAAVRPLSEVHCWARDPHQARRLVTTLCEQGFNAHIATDLQAACQQADIVSCATLSNTPLVQGAWLQESGHLDLIGGFTPQMREADDHCFAGAAIYVDNEEAWEKSGDLLGPLERGVIARGKASATLRALCQNHNATHPDAARRTVFKSVGSALEDLAAAILVYESANG